MFSMSIRASFFRFLALFAVLIVMLSSIFILPLRAGQRFKLPDEKTYSQWQTYEGHFFRYLSYGKLSNEKMKLYKTDYESGQIMDYIASDSKGSYNSLPSCRINETKELRSHTLAIFRKK